MSTEIAVRVVSSARAYHPDLKARQEEICDLLEGQGVRAERSTCGRFLFVDAIAAINAVVGSRCAVRK